MTSKNNLSAQNDRMRCSQEIQVMLDDLKSKRDFFSAKNDIENQSFWSEPLQIALELDYQIDALTIAKRLLDRKCILKSLAIKNS